MVIRSEEIVWRLGQHTHLITTRDKLSNGLTVLDTIRDISLFKVQIKAPP